MAFTLASHVRAFGSTLGVGAGGLGSVQPPTIGYHFELADQAATTTPVMQTPAGIARGRIVGRQKGWGSGNGSVGPIYEVQVAHDSGFTSQVRVVSQFTARRTGVDQTWQEEFIVPDAETYTFARVVCTLSGTDVVTFDAMLDFLPGY